MIRVRASKCCRGRVRICVGDKTKFCLTTNEAMKVSKQLLMRVMESEIIYGGKRK